MKKVLLALTALSTFALSANAQQRFVLYEEFTGENCGPCAQTNPGLLALMTSGTNPTKILMIKYMSPIPSAGPLYGQNTADANGRLSYYGVTSAPNGRMDGVTTLNGGHPAYMSQSIINTEYAVASPFNMTVTSAYTSDRDSVIATVTVTAVSAYAPANGDVRLRSALLETLQYATAPGTNGETRFENVVRKMYPSKDGTTIQGTWAVNESHTYTVSGPVPSYVDTSKFPFMAVWIQNDADKNIAQAGVSVAQTDAAAEAVAISPSLYCSSDGSASVTPSVKLINLGTNALTSATIYYKIDNGNWQSTPWTGSLATNASAVVALPSVNTTTAGQHIVYDSVAMPNGIADQNAVDNLSGAFFSTQETTALTNIPTTNTFEGTMPTGWTLFDADGDGGWGVYHNNGGTALGHNGSANAAMHPNYGLSAGTADYIIFPSSNIKAVSFYTAYARFDANSTDALDVVYSTDCGQNWTSVWSKSGAALATGANNDATVYIPTAAEWTNYVVDVTSAPAGALLAFKATTNGGNALWLDDVNVSPWPASVANVAANTNNSSINVYPNPARENATISVILDAASNVHIDVLDAIGRVVTTVANENMSAGTQKFNFATNGLAAGLYNVRVQTDNGTTTQQLSVVK